MRRIRGEEIYTYPKDIPNAQITTMYDGGCCWIMVPHTDNTQRVDLSIQHKCPPHWFVLPLPTRTDRPVCSSAVKRRLRIRKNQLMAIVKCAWTCAKKKVLLRNVCLISELGFPLSSSKCERFFQQIYKLSETSNHSLDSLTLFSATIMEIRSGLWIAFLEQQKHSTYN